MRVTVAVALPGRQEVVAVELAGAATVADALQAAQLAARFPGLCWRLPRCLRSTR